MSPTEKREAAFQREMSKPCAVRNLSDVFMAGVACGKAEIEGTIPMTTPKTPEGWQPIETAPEGVMILCANMKATLARDWAYVGWIAGGKICGNRMDMPTHWMPLPAAPGAPAAPSAEGVGSDAVDELMALVNNYGEECGALVLEMKGDKADPPPNRRAAWNSVKECAMRLAAPTAPAGGEAPVAWRVRGYAQFRTGKPNEWRYVNGPTRPAVQAPDCCDFEPLYTHPSADLRGAAEQALDAARYRWLRDVAHPDTNSGLRCVGNCADGGEPLHIGGRDLDRAVDAAIASLEAAISRKGKTE